MKIIYDTAYCIGCKKLFTVPRGDTRVGAFSSFVYARCPFCNTPSYSVQETKEGNQ